MDESLVVNDEEDIAFVSSLQSQYDDSLNFTELDPKTEEFLKSLDEDLDQAFTSMLHSELLANAGKKSKSSKSAKASSTSVKASSTSRASSTSSRASPMSSKASIQTSRKKSVAAASFSKPLSIVDEQWELIDPHPDIHALFLEFDKRFFYEKLVGVEVKWSPRMTLCAGVCSYEGRGGLCSVRLSVPLLKLRPRRDLVETLLHEMIHAFLFVTQNNRDRDGHGPQFLSHMNRINNETGTRISVYHSFHDEVDLYRQHWWKCNGPCQHRRPFYGFVKRAMNRAPGPTDPWWADHQASCNGAFIKVKEPENFKKKASKRKADTEVDKSQSNIQGFFKNASSNAQPEINLKKPLTNSDKINTISSVIADKGKNSKISPQQSFVPFQGTGQKLGSSSNELPSLSARFNISNTNGASNASKQPASNGGKHFASSSKHPKIDQVGSSSQSLKTGSLSRASISTSTSAKKFVQPHIQKFLSPEKLPRPAEKESKKAIAPNSERDSDVEIISTTVTCPVCSKPVQMPCINAHLDVCLP